MGFFSKPPKIDRDAVDDVLELSTGDNLEHHANDAATIAGGLLSQASTDEKKAGKEFDKAAAKLEISTSVRISKEKLVKSVTSVIEKLRN